ncbi:hypothetical protein L195_g054085 [Trifolium pratense]|uniref:Uncharacterized protein n=1 Tax=Trifolium pratense TaxID=57577 RepID=A0A2K3KE47_TRIPR|nr:hypothetical protein L195_g054085 [Trifolium pratense]
MPVGKPSFLCDEIISTTTGDFVLPPRCLEFSRVFKGFSTVLFVVAAIITCKS